MQMHLAIWVVIHIFGQDKSKVYGLIIRFSVFIKCLWWKVSVIFTKRNNFWLLWGVCFPWEKWNVPRRVSLKERIHYNENKLFALRVDLPLRREAEKKMAKLRPLKVYPYILIYWLPISAEITKLLLILIRNYLATKQ